MTGSNWGELVAGNTNPQFRRVSVRIPRMLDVETFYISSTHFRPVYTWQEKSGLCHVPH